MAVAEIGSYYISLVPTAHNLTGHIQRVLAPAGPLSSAAGNNAGGAFSHAFSGAIAGVSHAMVTAFKVGAGAAAAAVAAAGIVGVRTAAQLEQANIAFSTMFGDAEKATSFIADLKDFAKKTPFDFPGLMKSSQNLIAIGISADKVLPIMNTLGNVTSGMGTGAEGIKRATVALQQMNAAGKITAEDLNQLRDAGIPVYDLLTAATGRSKEEIADMREKGELGATELAALMTALETGKGLERFNGLMEAQSQSMAGLWATLKDTFSMGMADIIGPLQPLIKNALGGAIQYITAVTPPATAAMQRFVDSLYGANGVLDLIGDAWFNLRAGFNGQPLVEEHIFNMPLLYQVGEAVRRIVDWIRSLDYTSFTGFFNSITQNIPGLQNLGDRLGRIGDLIWQLTPLFTAFMAELGDQAPWLLGMALNLVTMALEVLVWAMPTLIDLMPLIVAGFIAWRVAALGALILKVALTAAIWGIQLAIWAWKAAVGVATAAQWLWNAAMSANPIALIIIGIVALTAALVWFFTQTELGAQVWNWLATTATNAWNWIVGAVTNAWNNHIWPVLQGIWNFITVTMAPVWTFLWLVVKNVWDWIVGAVVAAWNIWIWPTLQAIWEFITVTLGPVWTWLGSKVDEAWFWIKSYVWWAWQWILAKVFFPLKRYVEEELVPMWNQNKDTVIDTWNWIVTAISDAWNNWIWPTLQAIWWFVSNVLAPSWDFLWGVVSWVWNKIIEVISWAWNEIIWPILQGAWWFLTNILIPVWNFLSEKVKEAWDGISKTITDTWNWVKGQVLDPMGHFLTVDVPNAWNEAARLIGEAWNKIKGIAKEPIKWVVTEVINKGIVDTFNSIADKLPGVNKLGHVKLPDGWRTGGYTGDINPDAVAGVVHGKEYVLREKATSALIRKIGMGGLDYMNRTGQIPAGYMNGGGGAPPVGAQMAGPGTRVFGQSSFGNALQRDILATRKLYVKNAGGVPQSYQLLKAAGMWNGLANVDVFSGSGHPQVDVTGGNTGAGIAGFYTANQVKLSSNPMGGANDFVVAVHELGHALGLPHAHRYSANGQGGGDGTHSVMNYDTQWTTKGVPTIGDERALRAIYPGEVKGKRNSESGGEDSGNFNPFEFIMGRINGMIKDYFPKGGMFVDAAIGTGKKILNDVSGWVLDKIGGFWDWLTGGGGDKGPEQPGNVQNWASEALKRTGDYNSANLTSLMRRIMQESTGNPRAVNMWDSNAGIGGTHGLMQLLKQNFEKYHDSGLPKNIYDPLANIVAGINYTRNRYGGNLRAGWDRKGGYRDGGYVTPLLYDDGGLLHQGPQIIDHQRKAPDKVLTDSQWNAMYSIAETSRPGGDGVTMIVNPQPGQSEETIATLAARKLNRVRRSR